MTDPDDFTSTRLAQMGWTEVDDGNALTHPALDGYTIPRLFYYWFRLPTDVDDEVIEA